MSRAERLALIDRHDPALPVTRQRGLMTVSRSSVYRPPAPASDEDLAIMALIDRQYLARPYYGSRRMAAWLATQATGSTASGSSDECGVSGWWRAIRGRTRRSRLPAPRSRPIWWG